MKHAHTGMFDLLLAPESFEVPIPLTVNATPRKQRQHAMLCLRAQLGDLEPCELEDLR
jgi:hypothetical protein